MALQQSRLNQQAALIQMRDLMSVQGRTPALTGSSRRSNQSRGKWPSSRNSSSTTRPASSTAKLNSDSLKLQVTQTQAGFQLSGCYCSSCAALGTPSQITLTAYYQH